MGVDTGGLQCRAECVARRLCVDKEGIRVWSGLRVCGPRLLQYRAEGGSERPQYRAVLYRGVAVQCCKGTGQGTAVGAWRDPSVQG